MQVHENNYLSLVAQNNLNKSQSALGTAIERLSSGMRINSAKDDAAGLAIANRFTANVRGLTQAARNANDGISMAQTTEGAASEITTHMQRIRELTVQSANGSYSEEQLDSIQDEIKQRMDDINRISQQTDFNGVKVLSANAKSLTLQVGANDGETISLNLTEISAKTLGIDGFNVNGKGVVTNEKATKTDLAAAPGSTVAGNEYTVVTTHDGLTAKDALSRMQDGGNVSIGAVAPGTAGATKYTYHEDTKNFSFTDTSTNAAGVSTTVSNKISTLAKAMIPPAAGATSIGHYKGTGGKVETFTVDSLGEVKLDGVEARIDVATGVLGKTGGVKATLSNMMTVVSKTDGAGIAYVEIGNQKVESTAGTKTAGGATAGDEISYTDTISYSSLVTKAEDTANGTRVAKGAVAGIDVDLDFAIGGTGTSTTMFVDKQNKITTVNTFTNVYTFDPTTKEATVKSSTGSGDYAAKVGDKAYVDENGNLTTQKTHEGSKTKDAMGTLDKAFNVLNKLTSELGAVQNRLDSTIANLNNIVNNLQGARSRILDADYATEVSNMSRAQILQQAGTSVLAQANQVPQTVLSLLR